MYSLVEIESGNIPNEYDLDTLTENETIEDASNDMYVVHGSADSCYEVDAFSYFQQHDIHLCFEGSSLSCFAEWHDANRHVLN